ncbi:MAG TPA: cupin-like domain-containing protein [Croceibacterium sp.]|nr:cupin-like domain-containing protein [Croceibacterium sp.]
MSELGPAAAIPEIGPVDAEQFNREIRPAGQPVVLRRLVADWPAVAAARQSDEALIEYLVACEPARPVTAIAADPGEEGRFFYNRQLTGFNFVKGQGSLAGFLADLQRARRSERPPALAVQSEIVPEVLPAFAEANRLALLPEVVARIWIGNRIRVAPHYDLKENVACNVAGRRRFTVFPPDQLANLYPGPFEHTPAGTPVSMVDPAAPDLERFPRFAEAWRHAAQATLEPGDALYIPYMWWHGVDSLDPLSVLVNYWWAETPAGVGGPYDALLHAMLAYRHLPPRQREVWRRMVEHYVFESEGDPAAHLPPHAKGIMGEPSPRLFEAMRTMLRQGLDGR